MLFSNRWMATKSGIVHVPQINPHYSTSANSSSFNYSEARLYDIIMINLPEESYLRKSTSNLNGLLLFFPYNFIEKRQPQWFRTSSFLPHSLSSSSSSNVPQFNKIIYICRPLRTPLPGGDTAEEKHGKGSVHPVLCCVAVINTK